MPFSFWGRPWEMGKSEKLDLSKSDVPIFEGHFLYTQYGVMVGVDEDGQEVRQTHRPQFLRVRIRIEGGRLVVSPRHRKHAEKYRDVVNSLNSIQRIVLIPALWKRASFFPILICICCLLLWSIDYALEPVTEWVQGFWDLGPSLIRIGFGVLGMLFLTLPWIWQVWHKLWRTVVYSKVVVSTRKNTFLFYISSWKEADVANLLLQAGLPVRGEILEEE